MSMKEIVEKHNFENFTPETPTEYLLHERIKKLEREAIRLRCEANERDVHVMSPDKEVTMDQTIEKFWFTPVALASVTAVPKGQEVLIKGNVGGQLKHFEMGYFVHEDEFRGDHFVAERIHNLNQQCIRRIAEIYGGKQ